MRAFASAVDVPFDEACDKFHFDGLPLRVDGTAAKADIDDDDLIFYTGLTPNANAASASNNNTNSVEQSATTTTTARSEADRGERLRIKVRARDGTEKLYTIRSVCIYWGFFSPALAFIIVFSCTLCMLMLSVVLSHLE